MPVRLPLPVPAGILTNVIQPLGTLSTRRMTAHRVVLAAAGLTTLVAAAIGAALAVFVGQGLPLAFRHDLSVAPGQRYRSSAQ
jgi:hypothetical protein